MNGGGSITDILERIGNAIEGRYSVLRELGRGGMATVYLARDLRHERNVALKVLRTNCTDDDAVQRFLHEIRITARLQHPHILTLLDSGEANGYCYYVTPYMDGESLRQRLILEKQLPVEVALQLTRQVANALDYAHRHDVIHRDIKPENILLSGMHAVVSDFGIARATDMAGPGSGLQGAIGTMAYMSPEQVMNTPDLDGRSDIYALGCTLFEMLAGRTPFIGVSPQEIADQQLNATPLAITSIRPLVPSEVATAIARALAKNPADRFSTAAEFAAAITMTGQVSTLTPSTGYPLWSPQTGPTGAAVAAPVRQSGGGGKRFRNWALAAVAALVAVTTPATIILLQRDGADSSVKSSMPTHAASIAVLPFDNLSGGDSTQYFADGITEEIIAQLSSVQGLKVISRTSVSALKQGTLTIPQIADTLDVRHVLEGSVRRVGNTVRVTAQLIEAKTDAHLWSETFERPLTDVFSVQTEIAGKVGSLLSTVVQGLGSMVEMPRAKNSGAYDAYLQGVFQHSRMTAEGLQAGVASLRQAIALDSSYAPAYSALAEAYGSMTTLGAPGTVDSYRAYALAGLLSERAIALDPNLATAYLQRAQHLISAGGNLDSANADFERAYRLQPNAANVNAVMAIGCATMKKYDDAIMHIQRAVELDPVSPGVRMVYSGIATAAGRWDLVLEQSRIARQLSGPLSIPTAYEGAALMYTGHPEKCLELDFGPWSALRAPCLKAVGRAAEATQLLRKLEEDATRDGFTWVHAMALSLAHAGIGDAAGWARWLEKGVHISPEVYFPLLLDSDLHDQIRKDPIFDATLTRMKATIYRRYQAEYNKLTYKDALQ